MTQDELKLALEALKFAYNHCDSDWVQDEKINPAITAIKEALAQTQEPVATLFGSLPVYDTTPPQRTEQEPVGDEWIPCMKLPVVVYVRKQRLGETHVSTREGITPVKPDDLIMRGVSGEEYPIGRAIFERTYSLNTTPPQRTWVGLTDEEAREIQTNMVYGNHSFIKVIQAIEAKLKEKNSA